jgi:hypothetical protein
MATWWLICGVLFDILGGVDVQHGFIALRRQLVEQEDGRWKREEFWVEQLQVQLAHD